MNARGSGWPAMFAVAWITTIGSFNLAAVDLPPLPPAVHVLATDPGAAEEGTATATFRVVRAGPTNAALTVHYTLGGTAQNEVDYEPLSGMVTIPAGAFAAPVTIKPVDDFLIEGAESVVLSLQQPTNEPPPYRVTWPGTAVARIADNDRPATNAPPAVVLVRPPAGSVFQVGDEVLLAAHAWDVDGRVNTVEFFAGTNSLGVVTPRPVAAPSAAGETLLNEFDVDAAVFPDLEPPPTIDPIPISTHRFHLVWSNAPAGQHLLTAVAKDDDGASHRSPPVTIKVLDTPVRQVVEIKAVDPVATEPGSTEAQLDTGKFLITRHGPTNLALEVFIRLDGSASNGVDYVELPSQVTIPAGEHAIEVVISPLDDQLVEGSEHARLTILPPVCVAIFPPPPDCYEVGRAAAASIMIRDNDTLPQQPPVVRLVRPLEGETFPVGADLRIAAVAHDPDGSVAQVEFFESTNSLGVVTNVAAISSANAPAFQLVWTNVPPGRHVLTAEATDNAGAKTRSAPVAVKVLPLVDPPLVQIKVIDAVGAEVPQGEPADPARFEISRVGPTDAPLTVFYHVDGTARNGVDFAQLNGYATIPAGALNVNVAINVLDDLEVEGTEVVLLSLIPPIVLADSAAPVSAANSYRIGTDAVALAAIRDNEPPPANVPPKVALRSPQAGSVFFAPVDILLVAGASDPDGTVQSVEFFNITSNSTNRIGVVGATVHTNIPTLANFGPMPVEQMFQLVWSNAPVGTNFVHCKATDDKGGTAMSAGVKVIVRQPSQPPVVTIEAIDPDASEGEFFAVSNSAPGYIGPPIAAGTNTAVFAVHCSGPVEADLVVHYALSGTAQNGLDYQSLSGQVTIPRGTRQAHIVVSPIDDALVEGTETVVATLSPVAMPMIFPPPPGGYVVGEPHQAIAFIRDNDANAAPKVEIVSPRPDTVFAAPARIEIVVAALDPDGWVPRVDFYAGTQLIGTRTMQFLLPPAPGQAQRFSLVWSNAPTGTHVLSALATDDRGGKTRADGVPVVVVNQPELPRVGIQVVDGTASEQLPAAGVAPDIARFRILRTGSTAQSLTVHCQVSGTALNGVDYRTLANLVTIPQGAASVDIEVVPIDDQLVEGTESVILTLVVPNTTSNSYVPAEQNRAVAFILDNDTPANQPPAVALLNPADNSVFQAPTNLLLVAAAVDKDGWVQSVEFFDGTNSLGIVTNSPWVMEAEPLHIPGLNTDALLPDRTPDHPFSLMWSNVPVGAHELTALATDNAGAVTRSHAALVTVRETNAVPLVGIAAVDGYAREGTTNTALFRVSRTGSTDQSLTVFYHIGGTASNGVDYAAIGGSVVIAAGEHTANILISPLEDSLSEGVETVVLRLVPSQAAPDSYLIHHPEAATAIIADNDRPQPASKRLNDGSVLLQVNVPKGLPFRLEASDDLIHWEPVLNHVVGEDGVQFVDDKLDVRLRRFLRVVPDYSQSGVQ